MIHKREFGYYLFIFLLEIWLLFIYLFIGNLENLGHVTKTQVDLHVFIDHNYNHGC
jgi:hypothetical protein